LYFNFTKASVLAPIIFVVAFAIAWLYLGGRALPWWVDGGLWLKYADGLLGDTWPLWEENPLNYPPLFPSLVAGFLVISSDKVVAIKTAAAIAFALRPAAAFVASSVIFKSKTAGLVSSSLFMVLPLHVEMFGWGGYPNLMGISLIMIALASMVAWIRGDGIKYPALTLTLSCLLAFSHNLTSLTYLSTLTILIIGFMFFRNFRAAAKVGTALTASLISYLIYFIASSSPSSYVLDNTAAYYRLAPQISSGLLIWMFKNPFFLLLLYILFSAALLYAVFLRRFLEVAVLSAWLITPMLLLNLHALGIALDYARVFYFITDPLVLIASGSVSFLTIRNGILMNSQVISTLKETLTQKLPQIRLNAVAKFLTALLVVLIIAASASSLLIGFATFKNVEEWYNFRDSYGDVQKLEAIQWLHDNVPKKSVVVAEEEIARWIEGFSGRRTLMYAQPMYLFLRGEQERAYMAKAILLSSISLHNGQAWIYERNSPKHNITTIFALNVKGAFDEFLYLESNSSYVELVSDGQTKREILSDALAVDTTILEDKIVTNYVLPSVRVGKTVRLADSSPKAFLEFTVNPLKDGVDIKRFVVELKRWPQRVFFEMHVLPEGELKIVTELGTVIVKTNAKTAFPFIFKADSGSELHAYIALYAENPTGRPNVTQVLLTQEIMNEMRVEYVVLPKIQDAKPRRDISLDTLTRPEYMHLLNSPLFNKVYENERVIILRLKSQDLAG